MSKTLANLTLPLVTEAVDAILQRLPDQDRRLAFTDPQSRQQLISRVLSRVPNLYTSVEEGEIHSDPQGAPSCPIHLHLEIEQAVLQNIQHILDIKATHSSTGEAACHWFG